MPESMNWLVDADGMPSARLELTTLALVELFEQNSETLRNPHSMARLIMGQLTHVHRFAPLGETEGWDSVDHQVNCSYAFTRCVATVGTLLQERLPELLEGMNVKNTAYAIILNLAREHQLAPLPEKV